MDKLKLAGWKGTLDRSRLWASVLKFHAEPGIEATALSLIDGRPSPRSHWAKNTRRWYRSRARRLLESIILADPEWYGLIRIDPNDITTTMTTNELADFCQVSLYKVRKLARDAPGNGLPEPEWPLGRTLKGRGWRFPAEIAREYARRLLS